jgi:hypothetical protein
MPERDGLKSSNKDPLAELYRANQRLPLKRSAPADLVRYSYYQSHPEHQRRPLTRRHLRRR